MKLGFRGTVDIELGSYQLFLLSGLVFHDMPRDGACRYRKRRCQVHLSRPAAAREVAVLRADHNLVGTR
jgi:hypothetical protein